MACRLTNIDKISAEVRLNIAKDYVKRKQLWDLPSEARLVITNLIDLCDELLTASSQEDKLDCDVDLIGSNSKR